MENWEEREEREGVKGVERLKERKMDITGAISLDLVIARDRYVHDRTLHLHTLY